MLRNFVSAFVVVIMIAGVSPAKDKKPGKGKHRPHGKIVKVDGNKLTLSVGKKKTDKTFTLTGDTKYVTGKGKNKKDLKADEAKAMLKPGVRVGFDATEDGNIKTLHIGKAKGPKKPKADKKPKTDK